MSQQTAQIAFAVAGCIGYFLTIHSLSRKQKLTFRYTLGWLTLGIFGAVSISIIPFTSRIAEVLRVSPAAIIAVGAIAFFLAISVQLSISISGLQHQLQRIAEEIAIMRQKQSEDDHQK
jgi:hypothetical protein